MHRSAALAAALALAGCNDRQAPPPPEPAPTASPSPSPTSIIRPDVEIERIAPALKPLEATVPFAESEGELSEAAVAKLREVLDSEQMKEGGAITLRGHTDSKGRDEANLHVSQARAELVRDWLVEQGVPEERITIVALGEQRPVAPNAHLDGTPDEEGRAKNRRVDVSIALPDDDEQEAATDAGDPQAVDEPPAE